MKIFIAGKYRLCLVSKIRETNPSYVKFIEENYPHLIKESKVSLKVKKHKYNDSEIDFYNGYKSSAIKPNLNFDNGGTSN